MRFRHPGPHSRYKNLYPSLAGRCPDLQALLFSAVIFDRGPHSSGLSSYSSWFHTLMSITAEALQRDERTGAQKRFPASTSARNMVHLKRYPTDERPQESCWPSGLRSIPEAS
ncbi:MAG: hypothetical protein HY795_02565 [Desulfovibrio sp.]|nr:hypothetical protein [Desulfovibrio sp.]MBI4960385.1 hypothetical protein [Desulfovibrio sp.]